MTACSVRVLTNSCRYPSICHVSSRVACNGCLPLLPLHDTKVGSHWVFSHLVSFAFYGYIPIAFLCAVRDLHTRVDFRRTRYFRWRHTWFRQRILPNAFRIDPTLLHTYFRQLYSHVFCDCGAVGALQLWFGYTACCLAQLLGTLRKASETVACAERALGPSRASITCMCQL